MVSRQAVRTGRTTGNRGMRYPNHNWWVKHRPYQLQPVAIAPVMAGDSLRHARFEARVLTDPVKDAVTGWWAEYYLFHVPISVMDEYASLQTFFATDAEAPALTGLDTTEEAWCYYENTGNGPNWLRMAMKPIVRHYFRREDEDWNTVLLDTCPMAVMPTKSWTDSLAQASALGSPSADYSGRWAAYQQLRESRLTTMDFIEYLKSQGVDVPEQLAEPRQDRRKPELLRYVRQFTYPQNAMDATTGAVANACSWVVSERADKRIFCAEPGFLVLVSCVRPKLYRSTQSASGVTLLRNGRLWSSAVQDDAPQETLANRTVVAGAGPLNASAEYLFDSNGLLAVGDQFVIGPGAPAAAVPNAGLTNLSYPSSAELDALFTAGAANKVIQDGAIHFALSSRRTHETL